MDYRFALLHETFHGLHLDAADLGRLLRLDSRHVDEMDGPRDAIRGYAARAHLASAPWVERALATLELSQARGVTWTYVGESDYPVAWYDISCRPMLVSYRGDAVWRDWAMLSVVGSRTPSADTVSWMERELAALLARSPLGVVSGGARGVDLLAHELALAVDRPTVCLLPSGLLNPYPPGRDGWWEAFLARGGTLVSTFSLREGMRRHHFAIRNRWIAGLAPVTFVVEANRRSGSSQTARLAIDEQRTVCTRAIAAEASQGLANLELIRAGQTMIRDANDLERLVEAKILGPRAAKGVEPGEQEEAVDQPHGDARG